MKPQHEYNNRLEDFTIEFLGLQQERYSFAYYLNNSFLTVFDFSAELACNDFDIHIQLEFTKKSNLFILDFTFGGSVNVDCDRCLVQANLPVKNTYQVFVKTMGAAPERAYQDLDIVYLKPEDTNINIAQLIYEFLSLSIPVKRIPCITLKDKTICDQVVLSKWQEVNAADTSAGNKTSEPDPRWAALQKLKDKLNKP
ncbi:MAG TPA: DUF177 domain-containing protein [Chitinophagales bacterium]|nr:DUF177 domain-containing protein [Chitinophagales bacterium]HRK26485.1 DUF177 domain-containing protein [Chitinophagales bacterium]